MSPAATAIPPPAAEPGRVFRDAVREVRSVTRERVVDRAVRGEGAADDHRGACRPPAVLRVPVEGRDDEGGRVRRRSASPRSRARRRRPSGPRPEAATEAVRASASAREPRRRRRLGRSVLRAHGRRGHEQERQKRRRGGNRRGSTPSRTEKARCERHSRLPSGPNVFRANAISRTEPGATGDYTHPRMNPKLGLPEDRIDRCRRSAARVAEGVQRETEPFTTVSTERTVLRLLGVDGVDANEVPGPESRRGRPPGGGPALAGRGRLAGKRPRGGRRRRRRGRPAPVEPAPRRARLTRAPPLARGARSPRRGDPRADLREPRRAGTAAGLATRRTSSPSSTRSSRPATSTRTSSRPRPPPAPARSASPSSGRPPSRSSTTCRTAPRRAASAAPSPRRRTSGSCARPSTASSRRSAATCAS